MKGVKYLYDAKGSPEAVVIDLKRNRRLWEDIQDILVARQRRKEPRVSARQVDQRLRKLGKIP
jgi:hypothetical protein